MSAKNAFLFTNDRNGSASTIQLKNGDFFVATRLVILNDGDPTPPAQDGEIAKGYIAVETIQSGQDFCINCILDTQSGLRLN